MPTPDEIIWSPPELTEMYGVPAEYSTGRWRGLTLRVVVAHTMVATRLCNPTTPEATKAHARLIRLERPEANQSPLRSQAGEVWVWWLDDHERARAFRHRLLTTDYFTALRDTCLDPAAFDDIMTELLATGGAHAVSG